MRERASVKPSCKGGDDCGDEIHIGGSRFLNVVLKYCLHRYVYGLNVEESRRLTTSQDSAAPFINRPFMLSVEGLIVVLAIHRVNFEEG